MQTGDFSEVSDIIFLFTLTTNMIVTSLPEYLHENAMQKNKKINLEEWQFEVLILSETV